MSDESFDWDDENFDPEAGFAKKDQFADEDINIEDKLKEIEVDTSKSDKPKKSKEERIMEKKAERRAKELAKVEEQKTVSKPLTPQEIYEEKMRQTELQKTADLETTKQLFGTNNKESIDGMMPNSKEDFDKLKSLLGQKLIQFQASPHYVNFLQDFFLDICAGLESDDLRRLASSLTALAQEKQKMLKGGKPKKKAGKSLGGVGKAQKKFDLGDDEFSGFIGKGTSSGSRQLDDDDDLDFM